MKSIPIHFLEETLTFKLRGGSIKTMAGNGLTNIFWTQLTWFEYIVEEKKKAAGGGGGKAIYVILILLFKKYIFPHLPGQLPEVLIFPG